MDDESETGEPIWDPEKEQQKITQEAIKKRMSSVREQGEYPVVDVLNLGQSGGEKESVKDKFERIAHERYQEEIGYLFAKDANENYIIPFSHIEGGFMEHNLKDPGERVDDQEVSSRYADWKAIKRSSGLHPDKIESRMRTQLVEELSQQQRVEMPDGSLVYNEWTEPGPYADEDIYLRDRPQALQEVFDAREALRRETESQGQRKESPIQQRIRETQQMRAVKEEATQQRREEIQQKSEERGILGRLRRKQ